MYPRCPLKLVGSFLCRHATPNNVQVWLELIKFQDTAHKVFEKKSMAKVVLEKKGSIFERALKMNGRSDKLMAAYLDLCRRHMDISVVDTRWKKTIFTHAANPALWKEYLASSRLPFDCTAAAAALWTGACFNYCLVCVWYFPPFKKMIRCLTIGAEGTYEVLCDTATAFSDVPAPTQCTRETVLSVLSDRLCYHVMWRHIGMLSAPK